MNQAQISYKSTNIYVKEAQRGKEIVNLNADKETTATFIQNMKILL